MTFSLLARCPATGELGVAVSTSDVAVGARVPFAQAGVAVVATQHRTDPRLGPAVLRRVAAGADCEAALAATVAATEHRAWRQLGAIDAAGRMASFSGALVTPLSAELRGESCLVLGNMLSSDRVAPAMRDAFLGAEGPLAARLLAGMIAGEAAGGETGPLRSAALLVVRDVPFPLVDLRIDSSPRPLEALRELWLEYAPLVERMRLRALDPDAVPLDPDRAHGGTSARHSSTTT